MAFSVYEGYVLECAMVGQALSTSNLIISFIQKIDNFGKVFCAFLAGQGHGVGEDETYVRDQRLKVLAGCP